MVRYFRHARWRDRASFSFVLVERLAIGVPLSAIYEPIGRPLAGLEWKFEFFQLLSSKKFFVRLLGKIRILKFSLKNFVKKKYKMKIIFQFISQNWYFFLNKLYNNPIILLIHPIIQFFFQFPNLEREMPLQQIVPSSKEKFCESCVGNTFHKNKRRKACLTWPKKKRIAFLGQPACVM